VKDRRAEMVEGLWKAQAIRYRLAELERPAETYPENHSTRLLLESLGFHRARLVVERDISTLRGSLGSGSSGTRG
jgi:hypothetical protein